MAIAEPVTIEESARLVSRWQGAESRLFEVVGRWVPSVTGPAAQIYFDVCSQHHAWRANLWEERRRGLPAEFLSVADEPWAAIEKLAGLEGDVARLSAYCRVILPRTVTAYRAWQSRCSAVSDQPVARALGFALTDVLADWERGSALLAAYLDEAGLDEAGLDEAGGHGEDAATSAANACRELDRLPRKGSGPAAGELRWTACSKS